MHKILFFVLFVALLGMASCTNMTKTQQGALSGAAIGAGVGAGIGALTGGNAGVGALVGGAVGGLGGGLWGQEQERRTQHRRSY